MKALWAHEVSEEEEDDDGVPFDGGATWHVRVLVVDDSTGSRTDFSVGDFALLLASSEADCALIGGLLEDDKSGARMAECHLMKRRAEDSRSLVWLNKIARIPATSLSKKIDVSTTPAASASASAATTTDCAFSCEVTVDGLPVLSDVGFWFAVVGCGRTDKIRQVSSFQKAVVSSRCPTDQSMMTALHVSAMSGKVDVVETLLGCGASHSDVDSLGRTPLHYAVGVARDLETVKILLDAGASVDVRDSNQETPLDLAIADDIVPITTLLDKEVASRKRLLRPTAAAGIEAKRTKREKGEDGDAVMDEDDLEPFQEPPKKTEASSWEAMLPKWPKLREIDSTSQEFAETALRLALSNKAGARQCSLLRTWVIGVPSGSRLSALRLPGSLRLFFSSSAVSEFDQIMRAGADLSFCAPVFKGRLVEMACAPGNFLPPRTPPEGVLCLECDVRLGELTARSGDVRLMSRATVFSKGINTVFSPDGSPWSPSFGVCDPAQIVPRFLHALSVLPQSPKKS